MTVVCSKKPSRNVKLSIIDEFGILKEPYVFTTYRKVGDTCPLTCSMHPDHEDDRLYGHLCYARGGNTGIHQRRAIPDPNDGQQVRNWIQTRPPDCKIRLHVSGDFYLNNQLDLLYFYDVALGFANRPDITGWVYTHGGMADLIWMRDNSPDNLSIQWSLEDLETAQQCQDVGMRGLTCIVPKDFDRKVKGLVMCPEQTHGIPCVKCGLCMIEWRTSIVGFYSHR